MSIVVLGSANMDLVVRQARQPRPGETMFGDSFEMVPGGKGLNQAVAAARAGADVAFLGAVGRDPFGTALIDCLVAEGIGIDDLAEVDVPTGTAHITVFDDGENSIVVVRGANAGITELDEHARQAIERASYVVAQFERPLPLIERAFTVARERGVRTVLTPAPVMPAPAGLLELVDILIPNASEACELAGLDDDTAAALALSRRVGMVVMTRGSRGVLVTRDGEIIADEPARAVEPVDTTGAGDTFAGVLVARLAAEATLPDALAAAGAAASISVTRAGASTSMPTWDEIAEALASD
jgi:ribokinase